MTVSETFNPHFELENHCEISLEMTFDAAHRIVGHKGKCARLHGHTYKAHIMAAGPIEDPGFVVDFGDIKDLVNEWDHMTLLWDEDPLKVEELWTPPAATPHYKNHSGVIRLPFNPTAENMAKHLASRMFVEFSLRAVMVELWETPKSMARYLL